MKNCFPLLVIVIAFLLFNGCTKESATDPVQNSNQTNPSGGVLLKIDKTNTPTFVSTVTATLSRQGYDSLSKSMNLKTDTTADISFTNILIGKWHLKVDAKSEYGTSLYSGEGDVTVTESTTAQVSLVLNPTGFGLGNVSINVSWGPVETKWIDYGQNPVLTSSDSPTNPPGGVSTGRVIYDGGKYKMWYLNTYYGGSGDIGYAESSDGIKWNKVTNISVLKTGGTGSWDVNMVAPAAVIREGGMFKMWYTGNTNPNGEYNIGYAESQDGIYWTKNASPVLSSIPAEYQLGGIDLVKVGSTYFLFYGSRSSDLSNNRLNVATSTDGKNWTRYSGNPILTATQPWEGSAIAYTTVIYEDGVFKLMYMNFAGTGFGLATSTDGFHFTKSTSNPVFRLQDVSNQWCTKIMYPYWKKFGNEYRLYYSGAVNGANQIGLAIKK